MATPGVTTTLTVQGMTCGHCVASVTEELSELAGVQGVEVDLASGRVDVTSDRELEPTAVRAAVEAAGYAVA
jgi:copper chaperone CopZ